MLLIDTQIRTLALGTQRMLEPFSEGVQGNNVISFGLTSGGYDLRLGRKVLVFKNTSNLTVDPKGFKSAPDYMNRLFDVLEGLKDGQQVIIPPHSYVLGYSLEYIRMPKNLKGRCVGKSTMARCGILVNTTPLEPSWTGNLTIEIANISPCPVAIYVAEGIAQLEFETLAGICELDYADKQGKYQNQGAEPIAARVK